MTKAEFEKAFEAIESEAVAGRMSIPGALARAAMLALEYGQTRVDTGSEQSKFQAKADVS